MKLTLAIVSLLVAVSVAAAGVTRKNGCELPNGDNLERKQSVDIDGVRYTCQENNKEGLVLKSRALNSAEEPEATTAAPGLVCGEGSVEVSGICAPNSCAPDANNSFGGCPDNTMCTAPAEAGAPRTCLCFGGSYDIVSNSCV